MTNILYSLLGNESDSFILNNLSAHLPQDFKKRISQYHRWQDQHLSLMGRLLIIKGLTRMGISPDNYNIIYNKQNKPILCNDQLKFNISHSGNTVICAVTDTNEVGIDLEIINKSTFNEFKIHMTDKEWELLNSSNDPNDTFYHFWTQKEAVIKANGAGLSLSLKSFEIVNDHTNINGVNFYLKEVKFGCNYKCHLAFRNFMDTEIYAPEKICFFE